MRGDHQGRVALRARMSQQLQGGAGRLVVQAGGRFVGQQHPRLQHGARQRHALGLAAGELRRPRPRSRPRPGLQARRPGPGGPAGRRRRTPAPGCAPRTGIAQVQLLRQEADAAAAPGVARRRADARVLAGDQQLAGAGVSRPATSASQVDLPAPERPAAAACRPGALDIRKAKRRPVAGSGRRAASGSVAR